MFTTTCTTPAGSARGKLGEGEGAPADTASRPGLVLAVLLLATLALRLVLLPDRWINPDEGAHLMDALLTLEGWIPNVDFRARQPFYVYGLAAFLEVGGVSLNVGRLMPLAASLLSGIALYLVCAELVGRTEGLLAASMYLLLPLEVLQSVVVKTQAPATLLVIVSLWALVAGVKRDSGWLLVVAGVVGASGFYVRQTALLLPVVAAILLLGMPGIRAPYRLRAGGRFVAGYVATFAAASLWYARYLPWRTAVASTPFGFLGRELSQLTDPRGGPLADAAADISPFGEPLELYLAYLRDAIDFHVYLWLILPLAALAVMRVPGFAKRESTREDRVTLLAATAWLMVLALMYGYRFTVRGFFIDYFREFLPALCVFFGVWLTLAVPELRRGRNASLFVVILAIASAGWFALRARYPELVGVVPDFALAAGAFIGVLVLTRRGPARARALPAAALLALAAILVFFRYEVPKPGDGASGVLAALAIAAILAWSLRCISRGPWTETVRFAILAAVVGSYGLSLSHAADRLSSSYEAVWPPSVAAAVAAMIAERTAPDAEVASGAVVWEFTARRRPFAMISHPLGMKRPLAQADREALAARMRSRPPAVIVMDGYTQETYGRNVADLDSLVRTLYTQIGTFDEGFRPVRVLLRTARPVR